MRRSEQHASLEQQVRNVATEWTATFDAVESPILLVDGEGVVLRLNRAARDAAGGEYRDLLGRPIELLAPGEPWRSAAEAVRRLRREGEPLELHAADEASGKTWVLAASAVELPELVAARVVIVARDVTRLVALERSLRRSELLSAMGSLVAGVAQEVRRPLFAMTATVDALDACFAERDEDLAGSVRVLRNEIERLHDLMQDLLELGRPARPDRAPVSLADLLAEARSACELAIGGAGVEVVEALPPDLPAVTVDRKGVVQTLRNLLENAVQHSPIEGRVVVSAAAADGWVECTVRDLGPGFPSDGLATAFEPFSPRRTRGAGLGLAIVQHVVEEHGGEVTARNPPDGGAEVSIRLPATPAPAT